MHTAAPASSPIQLRVDASASDWLRVHAASRVVVIDWYASRRCAATVGDLRVAVASAPNPAEDVELEPVAGAPVLVERRLLGLLAGGAEIRLGGPAFARHLELRLDRPEAWLEFLEQHPASRR